METPVTTPTPNPTIPTFIDVMYTPGLTVYGMLKARLELTPDDHLKLTTVEGTAEAPVYKEVFNMPLTDIVKINSTVDQLTIVTKTGKYRVSVAQYSTPAIATGGVAGAAVAYGMYKRSGAEQWVNNLKDKGVQVKRFGYGKLYGVAFLGAAVFIAVAVLVYFLLNQ